jgi:hypothetical protein
MNAPPARQVFVNVDEACSIPVIGYKIKEEEIQV